jgi:hypothetical protein
MISVNALIIRPLVNLDDTNFVDLCQYSVALNANDLQSVFLAGSLKAGFNSHIHFEVRVAAAEIVLNVLRSITPATVQM